MVLSLYFFVAFADSFVFRQGYLFNYAGKVLQCFLRGRRIWRGWGWWIRGCSWLGYGRRLIAGGTAVACSVAVAAGSGGAGTQISWPMLSKIVSRQFTSCKRSTVVLPAWLIDERESFA